MYKPDITAQPSGSAKNVLLCNSPVTPCGTWAVVGTTMPAGAPGMALTSVLIPLLLPELNFRCVSPPCRANTCFPGCMSIRNGRSLCSMVSLASSSSAKPILSAICTTTSLTVHDGCWEKTAAMNSAFHVCVSVPSFSFFVVTKAVLSNSHNSSSFVTGWGHGLREPRYDRMFATGSETSLFGWTGRKVLKLEGVEAWRLASTSGNLLWRRVFCCIASALQVEMEYRRKSMMGRGAAREGSLLIYGDRGRWQVCTTV